MNIFYTDPCPKIAAQNMVNKHVVKMILEYAQLLSTAHRILDGNMIIKPNKNGRKMKRWILNDERETKLYLATHINHPSAIWCRMSDQNYYWLYNHLVETTREYTYRYGKRHKSCDLLGLLGGLPKNISHGVFTEPTPAMDDKYIIENDSLASYRNYYKYGKEHLHEWKNREAPEWIGMDVKV